MLEQEVKKQVTRVDAEQKGLISSMTNAVYDYEFIKLLKDVPWQEWMLTPNVFRCRPQFLEKFDQWIHSSKLNSITGLERFKHRDLINGTTQTFDEAYFKYARRRLRVFRGEYAYHRRVALNWSYIEDKPLEGNDYIIVSAPFCSTGRVHPQLQITLERAHALQIPVIIDCAYFGTCEDFHLDVTHPAIESVSFSLSKGLGLGDIRCGIRYSNIEDMNPIRQQNHYDHTVLSAARIGLYMMERLGPDFIPNKYSKMQKELCAEVGLEPTPCMHLALGRTTEWDSYMIDNMYARVGIRNLIKARKKGEI